MFDRRDVIYSYDGTFDGFLCCVFTSYTNKETPSDIYSQRDVQPGLLPCFHIATNEMQAGRVRASIPAKMGKNALEFLQHAFLSCLPQKELHMLNFMYLGYREGPKAMRMLADETVNILNKAVLQTTHEAHLYSGFVRFSIHDGIMAASIKPKACVLPLLGPHFAGRFPNERFLIYDETHRQVLAYAKGRYYVSDAAEMTMPAPDADELAYRRLWRMFYDTIAVEGRENYDCRRTHMPKRYWDRMTEFSYGGLVPAVQASETTDETGIQKPAQAYPSRSLLVGSGPAAASQPRKPAADIQKQISVKADGV